MNSAVCDEHPQEPAHIDLIGVRSSFDHILVPTYAGRTAAGRLNSEDATLER